MIMQLLKHKRKHILIDIDTQKDFLFAGGSACVFDNEKVLVNIRRIMAWARFEDVPIISIAEVHYNNSSENSLNYCLEGTEGQRKIRYTLLDDRVSYPADGWNVLPADLLRAHRQIILHKRCKDPFNEPRIDRLLSEVRADEFILIGVGAEDAVKATALGLLQRGKNVRVIVNALGSHNEKRAKHAVRMMAAKGAKISKTKALAGVSNLKGCDARQHQICPSRIIGVCQNSKRILSDSSAMISNHAVSYYFPS
jgi:nicotinamidase-related amidase